MNRKATVQTVATLIISIAVVVGLVGLIWKFLPGQVDDQSEESFKIIAAHLNILKEDLEFTDKSEITVPIYLDTKYMIAGANEGSTLYHKECKSDSCLYIIKRAEVTAAKSPIGFSDITFEGKIPVKTLQSSIIKVKLTAEKKDGKTTISMEKLG